MNLINNDVTDILSIKYQYQNLWKFSFAQPNFNLPGRDILIISSSLSLNNLSLNRTSMGEIVPNQREELDSFTITFFCDKGFKAYNIFSDWLNSVYDFKKRVWKTSFMNSKRDASVSFISIENGSGININKQFFIKGCMIKGVSSVTLDNENGEPLSFEASFEAEFIE